MKKDIQIGVRIPSELRDALATLAAAEHRTLAAYIRLMLEKHVAKREKRG